MSNDGSSDERMTAEAQPPYRSATSSIDWARACGWKETLAASGYRAEEDHTAALLVMTLILPFFAPVLPVAVLSQLGVKDAVVLPIGVATYLLALAGMAWRLFRGYGRWSLAVTESAIRFVRGGESVVFPTRETTADLCEANDEAGTSGTVRLRQGERESTLDIWSPVPVAKRRVERVRAMIDMFRAKAPPS